jgi:hypothetical protein
MREIRTSGSMSGVGKRDDVGVATAPILDSTENKGCYWKRRVTRIKHFPRGYYHGAEGAERR